MTLFHRFSPLVTKENGWAVRNTDTLRELRTHYLEQPILNDDDLARYSYDELLKFTCAQRAEIVRLRDECRALEQRVADLEGRPAHNSLVASAAWLDESGLRSALRQLDDLSYLHNSPLALQLAGTLGLALDGAALRRRLLHAIESLREAPLLAGGRSRDGASMREAPLDYQIIHLTYVEKLATPEIARHLSLSERQYYRKLKKAIYMVGLRLSATSRE